MRDRGEIGARSGRDRGRWRLVAVDLEADAKLAVEAGEEGGERSGDILRAIVDEEVLGLPVESGQSPISGRPEAGS